MIIKAYKAFKKEIWLYLVIGVHTTFDVSSQRWSNMCEIRGVFKKFLPKI